MRRRMLAVVQGRPIDRVPFVQYSGLAGPDEEIWSVVGRENMGLLRWCWCGFARIESPHCRFEQVDLERDGRKGFRQTLHTPEGSLWQERLIEPTYGTSAAREHFVKEPKDYKVLLAYFRDLRFAPDPQGASAVAARELAQDGLPLTAVDRTPFQQLWIQWVCLEDLCLHLVDAPGVMEEVFDAMVRNQRKTYEILCAMIRQGMDIPFVDIPDNLTAPVIGERYFRQYCLPRYRELVDMLAETGKDVPVYVHMDGYLKPLWQGIGESGIRGIDSLSPPPDNDTRPADVVRMWPQMRMAVNFPSSVHLAGPQAVYDCARDILQQAGHTGRLWIQISENVPPGMWRKSFPQIIKAINDFGRP